MADGPGDVGPVGPTYMGQVNPDAPLPGIARRSAEPKPAHDERSGVGLIAGKTRVFKDAAVSRALSSARISVKLIGIISRRDVFKQPEAAWQPDPQRIWAPSAKTLRGGRLTGCSRAP